jgi:hypothetical protein
MNFTNWKTMLSGGLTAAMGLASLFGVKVGNNPIDPSVSLTMIMSGIGLMFAKDFNVTGGTVAQPTPPSVAADAGVQPAPVPVKRQF